MKGGQKSEKQSKNWTGMEALRKVMRSMKKELGEDNVFKKEELTKRNMRELQDWVIANLFIGDDANPPTRLDYAPMLIVTKSEYKDLTEEEKEEMNFLVKNGSQMFFSFNDYKTSDKYGTKEIKVGKHLLKVLKFWLKHTPRVAIGGASARVTEVLDFIFSSVFLPQIKSRDFKDNFFFFERHINK